MIIINVIGKLPQLHHIIWPITPIIRQSIYLFSGSPRWLHRINQIFKICLYSSPLFQPISMSSQGLFHSRSLSIKTKTKTWFTNASPWYTRSSRKQTNVQYNYTGSNMRRTGEKAIWPGGSILNNKTCLPFLGRMMSTAYETHQCNSTD